MKEIVMKVTVINRGHAKNTAMIEVHRPGCGDLKRDAIGASIWDVDADELKDVVLDVYPPDDFQYDANDWQEYAGDVRVMTCCPLLKGDGRRKQASRYDPTYAAAYRARRYPVLVTMT